MGAVLILFVSRGLSRTVDDIVVVTGTAGVMAASVAGHWTSSLLEEAQLIYSSFLGVNETVDQWRPRRWLALTAIINGLVAFIVIFPGLNGGWWWDHFNSVASRLRTGSQ